MRLPFESDEACKLNRDIFETIYFGAVNASVEVSEHLLVLHYKYHERDKEMGAMQL